MIAGLLVLPALPKTSSKGILALPSCASRNSRIMAALAAAALAAADIAATVAAMSIKELLCGLRGLWGNSMRFCDAAAAAACVAAAAAAAAAASAVPLPASPLRAKLAVYSACGVGAKSSTGEYVAGDRSVARRSACAANHGIMPGSLPDGFALRAAAIIVASFAASLLGSLPDSFATLRVVAIATANHRCSLNG
eukprot:CAMPEP_0172727500 /NCGR_PEP_ID=MMETSP1074-20121228/91710_1 /TAXON_ID=2916 /ORGANISM="Ceratium fusus, Strain PA161109" /LENGTH=194 /DNA_ID=CAMNT_0013554653 /DNA_START=419 /DNA_END=1000 /DNA_ORIENTATION=-